jgi:hypothetical protein
MGFPEPHGRQEPFGASIRSRITGPTFKRIGLGDKVPSLFRLLVTVGLLVGLVYGAMLALITFVTPEPHEIIQTVPASRLNK